MNLTALELTALSELLLVLALVHRRMLSLRWPQLRADPAEASGR